MYHSREVSLGVWYAAAEACGGGLLALGVADVLGHGVLLHGFYLQNLGYFAGSWALRFQGFRGLRDREIAPLADGRMEFFLAWIDNIHHPTFGYFEQELDYRHHSDWVAGEAAGIVDHLGH